MKTTRRTFVKSIAVGASAFSILPPPAFAKDPMAGTSMALKFPRPKME